RDLDVRSDRLARHLRGLGVGPEVPVGIAVERSPDLAIGLLGILKAGGAFVPLDPSYPPGRLAYMLADSGARVLLTQRPLLVRLPGQGPEVVCLDDDREAGAGAGGDPPTSGLRPDHAAYIMYTSGSTGPPRGVVVTHRSLVNHNLAASGLFRLGPSDRVLQFSSPSFDIALEELFPAWMSGA